MKTAFINLPHHKRIIRRYTCVYYASSFLFPPLELMSLASILKVTKNSQCFIIDAIAKNFTCKEVNRYLGEFSPDIIVCMLGIETFDSDLKMVKNIKMANSNAKIICFGHLSSLFPLETLENSSFIDCLIIDEPENVIKQVYDAISQYKPLEGIKGIAFRDVGRIFVSEEKNRVENLDFLPKPAWGLVDMEDYREFLSPKALALIQTSRGCSYPCSYCLHTFGKKIRYKSVDNVLSEVAFVVDVGARTIRFIDDNFCSDLSRLKSICQGIIDQKIKVKWTCLSRPDHLDRESIILMKKAGCSRIYFGVETFSRRMQEELGKEYSLERFANTLKELKQNKIESFGFFMVGGSQSREEFKNDMVLSKRIGLDFVGTAQLKAYPGTEYFERVRNDINFSVFPYHHGLKDGFREEEILKWEKEFYLNFYLSPSFVFGAFFKFFRHPFELTDGLFKMLTFSPQGSGAKGARADII